MMVFMLLFSLYSNLYFVGSLSHRVLCRMHQETYLIISMVIIICNHAVSEEHCHPACTCEQQSWISAEWTVNCFDRGLDTLSTDFPTYTVLLNISHNDLTDNVVFEGKIELSVLKILDLSHNHLQEFPGRLFSMWKFMNLEVLNLSHNLLENIPTNLPETLRVLHLNHNKIEQLFIEDISYLINLKSIYLEWNSITDLKFDVLPDTINHCPTNTSLKLLSLHHNDITTINGLCAFLHLQYLYLSANKITSISTNTFTKNGLLKVINLSENKIQRIDSKAFKHLSSMEYLSLSGNLLQHAPENLPMMQWLDLSRNKIKYMKEDPDRLSIYPQDIVLLGLNPFHCDCHLLWLKDLYDSRDYQLRFIDVPQDKFTPVCSSPEDMANDSWDVISGDMFQCQKAETVIRENNEEQALQWKHKDTRIQLKEIGSRFIQLEWPINAQSSNMKMKLYFSVHPFGKKSQHRTMVIYPHVGSYRIKGLHPGTQYILCTAFQQEENIMPRYSIVDDCIEITTNGLMQEISWYNVILTASFYVGIAIASILSVCCGVGLFAIVASVTVSKMPESSPQMPPSELSLNTLTRSFTSPMSRETLNEMEQ